MRLEKGKITKREDVRLWCSHVEADSKILFYVGHLVAPKNVVVRIADTGILIIALANMEKAGINVWLEIRLHANNTLRYVNVNKLHQAQGNSLSVALPGLHAFIGSDYTASFNRKAKIRPLNYLRGVKTQKKLFLL